MFKRLFVCLLTLALLFSTACGKEEQEGTQLSLGSGDTAPAATSAPAEASEGDSGGTEAPSAAPTAKPSGGGKIEATVTGTAAYVLDDVLYGAAAFENTGSENILLTEATFDFDVNGTAITETFVPVMAEYDVIRPGETAYCTLFLPVEELDPGGDISLSASLLAVPAEIEAFPLTAESGYLVQNYPDFATLSGAVGNPDGAEITCELNMIHAGFYDENGAFLGAFYFSRNASLSPGVSKSFVVHLRALPIPNLAENTARIDLRAFGIE